MKKIVEKAWPVDGRFLVLEKEVCLESVLVSFNDLNADLTK